MCVCVCVYVCKQGAKKRTGKHRILTHTGEVLLDAHQAVPLAPPPPDEDATEAEPSSSCR